MSAQVPKPGVNPAHRLVVERHPGDIAFDPGGGDDALDVERVNATYLRLQDQARLALAAEGFAAHQMQLVRSADMRYFGQAWEVRVEVPAGPFDRATADVAVERFHAAHLRTYGYSYRESSDQRIEWVNLRVMGVGPIRRPEIQRRSRSCEPCGGIERARTGRRQVYFDVGMVDTPIYWRPELQPGDCVDGPSIIEEFGSTTVIMPGLQARVDDYANLLVARLGKTP